MYFLSLIAALAAVTPFSSASPTARSEQQAEDNVQRSNKFSLKQTPVKVDAARGHKQFGPVAYKHALAKYSAMIPTHVADAAAAASQSASVVSMPESAIDEEYLCPVQVGTPSKTLYLDFDSGSSDLWVFSTMLPAAQSKGHLLYSPASSNTSKLMTGYKWSISYGDGSGASGLVYTDRVLVGGVTASTQAVEAANTVSSAFVADTQSDGLLGLGFSGINTVSPKQQKTFFDTVRSTLVKPLFCSYLRHAAAGSYDFGFIDSKKYNGTVGYAPVITNSGYWEFIAGNVTIGTNAPGAALGDSIADTGTTLVLVPYAVANAYYSKITGAKYSYAQGGFVFPCTAKLQTWSVKIAGANRTIPASYINYAPVGGGLCYGGIQDNQGLSFSILGDVFLKSQYVVFDAGNTQIGFATQK